MKEKQDVSLLFSRITSVFLILMGTVFLLYTGEHGFSAIAISKLRMLRVLCCIYFGVMVISAGQLMLMGYIKWQNPVVILRKSTWTQRAVVVYLLLTWISALISPHFPDTIGGMSRHEGALTITIYCVMFLFVSVFGRADCFLLCVFSGAMTIQNTIAIAQLFGTNPFTLYPEGINYFDAGVDYAGAYLGTIGNIDILAAVVCIAVPIFLITLLRIPGKTRWWLLIPLSTSLVVLIGMHVLAGFVGVGAGLALTLPLILPQTKKSRAIAFCSMIGIGIAAVTVIFFVDIGTGLFHEIHELLHGNADPGFGSGRIYIWQNVLKLVPQNLLFGAGPDTLSAAAIEPFRRYDEALGMTIVSSIDTAHSEPLNILYHQGLLGLTAYLVAIGTVLYRWVRCKKRSVPADATAAAVVCYVIGALFGISMCINAPLFWLTLALLDRTGNQNGGIEKC